MDHAARRGRPRSDVWQRGASCGVRAGALLTLALAVWGAFLVPLRHGGAPVPVGLLVALATVPLCRAGAALLQRRAKAGVPMALWTAAVLALSGQRREGDLIVQGNLRGVAFLMLGVLGVLGAAVVVGTWRPPPAASG